MPTSPSAPTSSSPSRSSSAARDLHDAALYFNRELSWLAFNERVLEEAKDPSNPLLERLKFLAIFSTNLDEFVMIRYAGLKEQQAAHVDRLTPDGMTPDAQIHAIAKRLHPTTVEHRRVLREDVLPRLADHGVQLRPVDELSARERAAVDEFFERELFPVLTPLAVDASHPFPRLPNLSFSLQLELFDPVAEESRTAVVQVPSVLPRFLRLPDDPRTAAEAEPSGRDPADAASPDGRDAPTRGRGRDGPAVHRFVLLEDVIKSKVGALFPGFEVRRAFGFRITRNADIEIAEDEADDLLQVIEDEVRRRRWGDAVRLEVEAAMPAAWREALRVTMHLDPEDVYEIPNHLNAGDFMELTTLDLPELRYAPFTTRLPTEFRGTDSPFEAIGRQDVLLHHPFHAFDAVLDILEEAADDPDVLAIKQTLYRVGRKSPIVAALARAAGNGKLVTALVELKARFDEENNIVWARELERAGVHVVYGFAGLKTHCKALMVVRREGDAIRRYVHLGTGNYNPGTATIYTDLALLSTDADLAADVSELFNYLTGFSKQRRWRKLWVAPENLRQNTIAAIERETAFARDGHEARIAAKMNSLVDPEVIRSLYRASQAGVQVDLIVRGICCLRPGVEGVSENIRVVSVVGRFLEHSRAFWFRHGGEENLFAGSADWMQRNLNGRVEAIFPIEDAQLRRKVMHIFDLLLRDNVKARELGRDGRYRRVRRKPGQNRLDAQARLLADSARRLAQTT